MKKIAIGSLVGAVIFFMFQTIMWMSGFNEGFASYTANQAPIMEALDKNLTADGLYLIPKVDPADPDKKMKEETLWKDNQGKPWAMIFFHKSMGEMSWSYMVLGILYSLLACVIAALLLTAGNFMTFNARFWASMALSLFTICEGVLDDMNWWSYPWSFVRPELTDLVVGWGITSLWMAWYFKKA